MCKVLLNTTRLQSIYKLQLVTDGNPNLCEGCILGHPIERLDSPALPIQFCNGNCLKFEIILQESIHYVLYKVFTNDHAQQISAFLKTLDLA